MIKEKTFERALHSWDKWRDSIEAGRREFHQSCSWPEMELAAKKNLNDLGFPSCPVFELYWLCCVFSQYRIKQVGFNFDKIVMPDWFPLPFGSPYGWAAALRGKRIYPPMVWESYDFDFSAKWQVGLTLPPPEDFIIVLPAKHPVREFVTRGRPPKKKDDGTTYLETPAKELKAGGN